MAETTKKDAEQTPNAPAELTEDEKALQKALAEQEPHRPPMKEITGVRYLAGQTDERRFTVEDQARIGITGASEPLVWNAENNFFVDKSHFNAAALDWFATNTNFSIE